MNDPATAAPDPERFLASGLDLAGLRALLERLAPTSLGLRAVRELAPRAEGDARAALERVRETAELERAGALPSLAGVCDIAPRLAAARRAGRPLEKPDLASLAAWLEACARLAAWHAEHRAGSPALAALLEGWPDLSDLRAALERSVDHRGELLDGASPRLARLRREARELDDRLAQTIARIAARPELRAHLAEPGPQRRGGRAVLAVRARSAGRVRGIVHDRSASGETVYVEPREAVELANELAGVDSDLRSEEARLLIELTREILAGEPRLAAASARIAELELARVGAALCREYGARVPRVAAEDEEPRLVLRSARHPLLVEEALRGRLAEVVPIDVRLGGEFDLLVVTGPNTGGKTLALKTVALAALLARMGLPTCCAEGSSVPLYDGLVVDIGDEQELSQSLSTFASHLERIRAGLARAGPRTLVLLDELGGGTDPDEGAALGDAILEHLLERRVPTIATTHLGKLKEFAFRHARAENASVEFDPETLQPRYRLLIGTPGESNAIAIAERLGLDAGIVSRARERLERHDREVLELMAKVRGAREHAERLRGEAESRLEELSRSERGVREQEAELAERRERVEREAQLDLEERVREARRKLEQARALLPQVPAKVARELGELLEGAEGDLSGAAATERRRRFLARIKKGEMVSMPRLGKRGVVMKVDRARGEVTVRVGRLPMTVKIEEVSGVEGT
jgi:DNA mismatch repair protein MutS2